MTTPAPKAPRYPAGVRLYPPAHDLTIAQRIADAAAADGTSSSTWLYRAAVAYLTDKDKRGES